MGQPEPQDHARALGRMTLSRARSYLTRARLMECELTLALRQLVGGARRARRSGRR